MPTERPFERGDAVDPDRSDTSVVQRRVLGMDCAKDAAAVARIVGGVPGVVGVRVSSATHIMTATLIASSELPGVLADVQGAVAGLGYALERLDPALEEAKEDGAPPPSQTPSERPRPLSTVPTGYRRALALVVALNLGYGIVEVVGGFLAHSQALKADALDFLGDGLVTGLALVAIRWSLSSRARVALAQGVFLLLMAFGVCATTLGRMVAPQLPQAEIMGAYGAVALVVNVLAALALVPFRKGHDASARAVWRFSAADAAANAATVGAAGLVAWLQSPWPDLVVALLVAGLFFRSAWAIIWDALADLREGGTP